MNFLNELQSAIAGFGNPNDEIEAMGEQPEMDKSCFKIEYVKEGNSWKQILIPETCEGPPGPVQNCTDGASVYTEYSLPPSEYSENTLPTSMYSFPQYDEYSIPPSIQTQPQCDGYSVPSLSYSQSPSFMSNIPKPCCQNCSEHKHSSCETDCKQLKRRCPDEVECNCKKKKELTCEEECLQLQKKYPGQIICKKQNQNVTNYIPDDPEEQNDEEITINDSLPEIDDELTPDTMIPGLNDEFQDIAEDATNFTDTTDITEPDNTQGIDETDCMQKCLSFKEQMERDGCIGLVHCFKQTNQKPSEQDNFYNECIQYKNYMDKNGCKNTVTCYKK